MLQDLLTTIPAFLFALGLIVFVHEGGHYVVAKLFGVQVKVFSLGFGLAGLRALFSPRRAEGSCRLGVCAQKSVSSGFSVPGYGRRLF